MDVSIAPARLQELLRITSDIADTISLLAERRRACIQQLGKLVNAPSGFWGWGRGNPVDSEITPLAALCFGMTPEVWHQAIQLSMAPDTVRLWSIPIRQRMEQTTHVTVIRSMLHTDEQWEKETLFRQSFEAIGMEHLLVSVNYYSNDCWFHATFSRHIGQADFEPEDAAIINLAMSSISWMQPRVSESVPPESFVGLTPRQRTVMLHLLDGQSRKQIAKSMGITLNTANDHIKAIYDHFQVGSATELAARFLQNH